MEYTNAAKRSQIEERQEFDRKMKEYEARIKIQAENARVSA
jgi:hypothetical protein